MMLKLFEKNPSEGKQERAREILFSLKIVVNVIFALCIFQVFLILPRPGDPELERVTLRELYEGQIDRFMVMTVGLVLTIIYWLQLNKQLGNLQKSEALHAFFVLLQMFFLMLYLYFIRIDIEYDGLVVALQMQSVFLALAGFTGVGNWLLAQKLELISERLSYGERKKLYYGLWPEPTASLIALPFASISAEAWSLSFLAIIPLTMLVNYLGKRAEKESK